MRGIRRYVIILTALLAFASAALASPPVGKEFATYTGELSAEALMDEIVKAIGDLESYRVHCVKDGYASYQDVHESNEYTEEKSGLIHAETIVEFKRPYLVQIELVASDVAKKIMLGMLFTYRADKNENIWWAKPRSIPFALKKKITDDGADVLTMNFQSVATRVLYHAGNSDASIAGVDEIDGVKCIVLRLTFDKEKVPVWNKEKPPYDKLGIPKPMQKLTWEIQVGNEKRNYSRVDYFFDARTFLPMQYYEYVNGNFFNHVQFRDIETNGLTEEDF